MWFERQSYGRISEEQQGVIRRFVKDRVVTDLGAFKLAYSELLLTLGAKAVIAVDKEYMGTPPDPRITCVEELFADYRSEIDTAFVSWPANYENGLVDCVKDAKRIIVVSKNTDGTSCGTPEFYEKLLWRKLDAYVPDKSNSLIVVSRPLKHRRKPRGEENAGRYVNRYYEFEESEAVGGRCKKTA